jgi:signal transduction histidine kinase/ligand-binding sensor domain-containing protein
MPVLVVLMLLAGASALFVPRAAVAQNLRAVVYNVGSGLPTDMVKSTFQDERGFIWIATDIGLLRFDGRRYVLVSDLPSAYVKSILQVKIPRSLLHDSPAGAGARKDAGLSGGGGQANAVGARGVRGAYGARGARESDYELQTLVVTDLGVVRLGVASDTTRVMPFVPGSTRRTDSTLFYPKSIYQDRHGRLWVSEPDAIVLVEATSRGGRVVKRYLFNDIYTSDSFSRSFSLADDARGRLVAVSQRSATLFAYDDIADAFVPLPLRFSASDAPSGANAGAKGNAQSSRPFFTASAILPRPNGSIWVGTNAGVYEAPLHLPPSQWQWRLVAKANEVSCLDEDRDGILYAGTWFGGLYRLLPNAKQMEKFGIVSSNTINHIRVDDGGALWTSGDDGMTLVQPTVFRRVAAPFQRPYIQSLMLAANGDVVATDGAEVYSVGVSDLSTSFAVSSFVSRLLARAQTNEHSTMIGMASSGTSAVIGTSQGGIFRVDGLGGKNVFTRLVQLRNVPVFFMYGAADGSQWACQQDEVIRIMPDGGIRMYGSQRGMMSSAMVIRSAAARKQSAANAVNAGVAGNNNADANAGASTDGNIGASPNAAFGAASSANSNLSAGRNGSSEPAMYAGARNGPYLYRYDPANDVFINLSVPPPFKTNASIGVTDLALQGDSVIWLGTNVGLLRYRIANKALDTIALPKELARQSVNAVHIRRDGALLFTTDQTLNLFRNNQLLTLDLRSGNSAMTTTARSLVIDARDDIWLGTTQGLLYLRSSAINDQLTPEPVFTAMKINGSSVPADTLGSSSDGSGAGSSRLGKYESGAYLEAQFAALSYPADRIRYQTRLIRNGAAADSAWSESSFESFTILPPLKSGDYTLQVRAQQAGRLWSDPTEFSFRVVAPWYLSWWAWMLYACLFVGTVAGVTKLRSQHLERRNIVLRRQVAERTAEIERQMTILDEQAREIELANTQLQHQNVELQQLNAEKNEFLGMAAHDLKNPLTTVMMSASMVQRYGKNMSADDIAQQMQNMERTAKRMHDIITNLLDINAIETGNVRFSILPMPLVINVRRVVDDYRARAEAKNIQLAMNAEREELSALADESAVIEIIENLVSNAIKYSPHGASVAVVVRSGVRSVVAEEHENGVASVSKSLGAASSTSNGAVALPTQELRCVRVEVKDSGPGLSEDDKRKLFGKFARLTAQPTGGEHSTGLGLSIVKKMTEAMNGRVWCESQLGHGATFIVEFLEAS